MSIIDLLKKRKKEKEKKEEKKAKEETTTSSAHSRLAEKKENWAWRVLKAPHLTEKATELAKNNQYVFKIWPKANKKEIKKAIEDLYRVDVLKVRIINVPPKRRRLGRIEGWRKKYKKAIVKIKEGQKIDILPK